MVVLVNKNNKRNERADPRADKEVKCWHIKETRGGGREKKKRDSRSGDGGRQLKARVFLAKIYYTYFTFVPVGWVYTAIFSLGNYQPNEPTRRINNIYDIPPRRCCLLLMLMQTHKLTRTNNRERCMGVRNRIFQVMSVNAAPRPGPDELRRMKEERDFFFPFYSSPSRCVFLVASAAAAAGLQIFSRTLFVFFFKGWLG